MREIIHAIQNAVADIPNIGSGGCCYFAAIVVKELNNIGVDAFVRFAEPSSRDFEKYEHAKVELFRNGTAHSFIELGDVWFDNEDIRNIVDRNIPSYPNYSSFVSKFTLSGFLAMVVYRNYGQWNNLFDHSRKNRRLLRSRVKMALRIFSK